VIKFENPYSCQARQAPRSAVEAGSKNYDLMHAAFDGSGYPVVDESGPCDTGCACARPTAIDERGDYEIEYWRAGQRHGYAGWERKHASRKRIGKQPS
jgi:hypothetical protein